MNEPSSEAFKNGAAMPEQKKVEDEELPGLSPEEVAQGAPAEEISLTQKAEAVIDSALRQPLGIMLRGIMVSAPGLDPVAVLKSVARVMAGLMGDAVAGDLAPVLQARGEIKKSFDKALSRAPIKPNPNAPAAPSMTAAFHPKR